MAQYSPVGMLLEAAIAGRAAAHSAPTPIPRRAVKAPGESAQLISLAPLPASPLLTSSKLRRRCSEAAIVPSRGGTHGRAKRRLAL